MQRKWEKDIGDLVSLQYKRYLKISDFNVSGVSCLSILMHQMRFSTTYIWWFHDSHRQSKNHRWLASDVDNRLLIQKSDIKSGYTCVGFNLIYAHLVHQNWYRNNFTSLSSEMGDNSKFRISKQWLMTNNCIQVIEKTLFF